MTFGLFDDRDTNLGPYAHCIFCGGDNNGKALTDEHAFPAALGGRLVLTKATCTECQRKTDFEGRCINSMFEPLRQQFRYTTARASPPERLLAKFTRRDGTRQGAKLDREEYPAVVPLPLFYWPTILSGEPDQDRLRVAGYRVLGEKNMFENSAKAKKKRNAVRIEGRVRVLPQDFARMLAKIAHCWGVAELGHEGFSPTLKDAILTGNGKDLSRFVGCLDSPVPMDPPITEEPYQIFTINEHSWSGLERLLVFSMEYFAGVYTAPVYAVCFGWANRNTEQGLDGRSWIMQMPVL